MIWSVSLDKWGRATNVVLDGMTIEGVAGIEVSAVPGQPPALTLYPDAGVELDGEGLVQVVPTGSMRAAVLAFVDTLDAESFEREMLEHFEPGVTTGGAALAVIRSEADKLP